MKMVLSITTWEQKQNNPLIHIGDVVLKSLHSNGAWMLPDNMKETLCSWCDETIGSDNSRWQRSLSMFQFAHRGDLTLFVARWQSTDYAELQQITRDREAT